MKQINKFYLVLLGLMLLSNWFSGALYAQKSDGGLCTVITQSILKSCAAEILTYQKEKPTTINLSKDFCPYIANKVCSDCCSDLFAHLKKTNKNQFSKAALKDADMVCIKACQISSPKAASSTKPDITSSDIVELPSTDTLKIENSIGEVESGFIQQEQKNFPANP